MIKRATPTAARLVEGDKDLLPVLSHVSDLQALQRIFAHCVGAQLAASARVCELTTEGQLTLAVDSSAAATLIKQQQVRITRNLVEKGVKVTKLRPQVQVTAVMPTPVRPAKPPLPISFIAKIAEDMAESPLKLALREIVGAKKQGKR